MINISNKDYYSIKEVNEYIKSLFDNTITLQGIGLIGEISNYRGRNRNGHIYFSLKDEFASINAVMFKYDTMSLDFEMKDGDEVLVVGSISSYTVAGTYQIICKKIIPYGEGNLLLKKEMLKNKLVLEGLFDVNRKKKIPIYPEKIGIITGKNSAAERDFVFNLNRRNPMVKIKVYGAKVQGSDAPQDLIRAITECENDSPDIIILGRGGGSVEDLSAFDDEKLVRKVANCKVPIITAIGHEINLSLCDLSSDAHASTPTGACEIAVSDIKDLYKEVEYYKGNIQTLLKSMINRYELRVANILKNKVFVNVGAVYDQYISRISNLSIKIENDYNKYIVELSNDVDILKTKIELSNPLNLLKKGYVLTFDSDGKLITNVNKLHTNDQLTIRYRDGQVNVVVVDKIIKEGVSK